MFQQLQNNFDLYLKYGDAWMCSFAPTVYRQSYTIHHLVFYVY